LVDGVGAAAADRLETLEHVGLELAEAQLDLPAPVIERAQLRRGVLFRIDQGGQQDARGIALALVADGADVEVRGQMRMVSACFRADLHLDQLIVLAEVLDHTPHARSSSILLA
jgi:hypothetical protein